MSMRFMNKGERAMKKTIILVLMLTIVLAVSACGKKEKVTPININNDLHEQNYNMLYDTLKIKEKNIEKLLSILEEKEPDARIMSVDVYGLDGGMNVYIIMEDGLQYCANISMSGDIGNVKDMDADEYIWLCTEHEDEDEEYESDYERAQHINMEMMMQNGLSETETEEFMEVLNRAVFDEEISDIFIERKDGNITVTVTMDTRKIYKLEKRSDVEYISIIEQ